MPGGELGGIKRHFQHHVRRHRPHRAKTFGGVVAHPFVEKGQFGIGKPGIGLAHRQQHAVLPQAKGIIGIKRAALAVAALGIHQHGIDAQRVTLPFPPETLGPPRDIGRISAFEHEPLNGGGARVIAQAGQFIETVEADRCREIHPRGLDAGKPRLQPCAALVEGQGAQILRAIEQNIIEPHQHGVVALHFCCGGFAVQRLLHIAERRHHAVPHHQQLAIDDGLKINRPDHLGEGG